MDDRSMTVADESALELEPHLAPFWEAGDRGLGNARARWQRAQRDYARNPDVRVLNRAVTPSGLLTTTLQSELPPEAEL